VPGNADQPCQWRERVAENTLQRDLRMSEEAGKPADGLVQKCDQPDEGDQHRTNVDRNFKADRRTRCSCFDDIGGALVVESEAVENDLARLGGREDHLREQQVARHRHERSGQQYSTLTPRLA